MFNHGGFYENAPQKSKAMYNEKTQHDDFNNFEPTDHTYVQIEETPTNEIPWKQLSIGGAFGLLIGGGSIIAANSTKSNEEEALLAGAKAGGDVKVEGEDDNEAQVVDENVTNSADVVEHAPKAHSQANATPTDDNVQINTAAHEVPQNHSTIDNHTNATNETSNVVVHHVHHVVNENYDVYHQVNVIDMDDSMSFAQAFAQARAELGPGAAFEWRGGVFGTYYQSEWNSMTHAEQNEFTATAMNTSIHSHHDLHMAKANVTHHFTEGDVIDLDTGMAYHDEPYYVLMEINDYDNNDVEVYDDGIDSNDIEIIDVIDNVQEHVQDFIDLNDSVGDFLSGLNDVLDHAEDHINETYDDVASIIENAQNVYDQIQETFDTVQESDETPNDILPDYVSDADTFDIV